MVQEIRTCDICEEQIEDGRYYKVKIRSGLFVNYFNYDTFGADKRTVDVCENCTSLIIQFVKDMKGCGSDTRGEE